MECPKCGFQQQGGAECQRCGVVFERYRRLQQAVATAGPLEVSEAPGVLRRLWRIGRWLPLLILIVFLVLVLRKSEPPQLTSDSRAARRVEVKLREVQEARSAGDKHTLRLDETEVNSWIDTRLVMAPAQQQSETSPARTEPDPTLQEVQSSVRDIKVDLKEDRVRAYVIFDFRGKDLSFELEGSLRAEQGYLRLAPTGGKLGSLPLPQAALQSAVDRLFESPENKEKFKLPAEIESIQIQNGQLVVVYRP